MERALYVSLLGLLVWAPLPLASNRFWSLSLLQTWVGVLFALWLVYHSRQSDKENTPTLTIANRNRDMIILFWLIPLWSLIQLIPLPPSWREALSALPYPDSAYWHPLSMDIGATLFQTMESIAYAMFFTLALNLINTPARLQRTCELLVVCGVLQASYGVMVTLGGKGYDLFGILYRPQQSGSASGTFANRNHLAGYLEMCLAIGVGLLLTHMIQNNDTDSGWRAMLRRFLATLMSGKARLRIFLALMVVALVLTHSRMGNSAFFASLGISAVIGLFLYARHKRSTAMVILFSSLIAIDSLILGAWFGLDKLAARLEQTTLEREERTYVFSAALDMLKEVPITGVGAGAFGSTFDSFKTGEIFYDYDLTHNDYLQIAIEYGVIGSMLFGLIVIHAFRLAIVAQRSRHTAILKGAGFASMMGIISLMIHSWVDFNLQIPANALMFTLLCAFACIATGMELQSHQAKAEPGQHRSRHRRHSSTHTGHENPES